MTYVTLFRESIVCRAYIESFLQKMRHCVISVIAFAIQRSPLVRLRPTQHLSRVIDSRRLLSEPAILPALSSLLGGRSLAAHRSCSPALSPAPPRSVGPAPACP